ncbi:Alpha/Beta hydrolase protein [Schizophyllum commune]
MLPTKTAVFALLLALRVSAQLDDETLGLSQHAFPATSNSTINESLRPVVDLGYARYEGIYDESTSTNRFLGIRYAAPPTGSLRWRPPHPPATETDESEAHKADTLPPMCYGTGFGFAPLDPPPMFNLPFSEDCLFLNVFTTANVGASQTEPADAREEKPVLVWIHGGGFNVGSIRGYTGQDVFDGQDLVDASNGDFVVVVMQYRLNVFGFLAGEEVKKEGVLNAGLLDQQFALRWIQSHIAKFGGDPNDVTLFGESAGGASVLQHVIANGGQTDPPLFHKAMIASYSALPQYDYNHPVVENDYNALLRATDCSSFACLRTVDAPTLRAAAYSICASKFYGSFSFLPVVDGDLIQQRPLEALLAGRVNVDKLLATTNTNEGAYFTNPALAHLPLADLVSGWFPALPAEKVAKAVEIYQPLGTPEEVQRTLIAEAVFVCPSYSISSGFKEFYKATLAVAPAGHGHDVNYYFKSLRGNPVYPHIPPSETFADAFTGIFTSYARDGRPSVRWGRRNSSILTRVVDILKAMLLEWRWPAAVDVGASDASTTSEDEVDWPAWSEARPAEVLFNVTESGEPYIAPMRTDPGLLARCEFWRGLSEYLGQ